MHHVDSPTEIEQLARHRMRERTAQGPYAQSHTVPRPRRRGQMAAVLRKVADRLDD